MGYCNWNVSKKKNKIDRLYDVFEYVKNGIQRDFTVLLNNCTRLTELEMRKKTIKNSFKQKKCYNNYITLLEVKTKKIHWMKSTAV